MEKLIDANLHFLEQAAGLVDRLENGCYAKCEPGFYNSSVGAHLRHCLEHYEAFVIGLEAARVDYDARKRNLAVETDTQAARERIDDLISFFVSFKENSRELDATGELQIKIDCGENHDADQSVCNQWQVSSIGRELQFLVSHTVHHFAMIRSLCVGNDTEICTTFGVAPSTLKHRAELAANTA